MAPRLLRELYSIKAAEVSAVRYSGAITPSLRYVAQNAACMSYVSIVSTRLGRVKSDSHFLDFFYRFLLPAANEFAHFEDREKHAGYEATDDDT